MGLSIFSKCSQELTLHPHNYVLPPEAIAMALMSQAPTLRALSMHHDAMPRQYVDALTSLRSLTTLEVRRSLAVCTASGIF